MKKLFFLMLFSVSLFAQVETRLVISDTLSNDAVKTGYVGVPNGASEVVFVIHATGELDVDQMIVTEGWASDDGIKAWAAAQVGDTTTVTLNLAAGAYGSQASATRSDFEGANIFKVVVTGAAAGNDSGDPNRIQVYAQFYK